MATFRNNMRELMLEAWQLVKRLGMTMSEAMKASWLHYKLKSAMHKGIVKFYFQKVDGSIREAYGTLKSDLCPDTKGTGRKSSALVQTYYDAERKDWRSFKVANLLSIAY